MPDKKVQISSKVDEIYQDLKSGVILAYVIYICAEKEELRPDF